jgi:hypothetical protein
VGSLSSQSLERLRREIAALQDSDLVVAAWDQFWHTFASDETIDPILRVEAMKQLRDAESQLRGVFPRSAEGRGRLRSFLLNEQLRIRAHPRARNGSTSGEPRDVGRAGE